ncbi:MAG: hypothetical protein HY297_03670 [Thaumarchaeota archaeon]|nr:hypothetical protein [Nitrososphaerota archaeon]
MSRICVVTERGREYYAIVSRLRKAALPFESRLPDSDCRHCDLVLTSASEAGLFGDKAMPLEGLHENPGIFRGQVISRLGRGEQAVTVGIDPGKRIGMAVFYGDTRLALGTFNSVKALCERVGLFARNVAARRFVVKVGNGDPKVAAQITGTLAREVPEATVEVVDESGTSARSVRLKGVQVDQIAAAKIAFRRGEVVTSGRPRTRGRGPPTTGE